MTPLRLSFPAGPRLLAGIGTLTLLAGIGLISSRPAHTAGGPIAVSVANTPLAVTDTEAAHTPFQTEIVPDLEYPIIVHPSTAPIGYRTHFSVPAGKRLVLQGLSANFSSLHQSEKPLITVRTLAGGSAATHNFTANIPVSSSGGSLALSEIPCTIYADPSSTVTVEASSLQLNDIEPGDVHITLTGYLVDVPEDRF